MVNRSARTLWLRNIQPTFVVLARLVVGATFVFSGFVKSVDPMGTSLKIREYLSAFELDYIMPISLFLAMCIGVYELVLGVNTLFGSYRRVTSILLFLTMLVMTPLTLYLALADPISDCGCFGEAVYLTHWQSFSKNVVLLLLTVFLLRCNHRLRGVYHKEIQSLTVYFVVLFAVGMSLYAYYFKPVFDFRPYKLGTNIEEAISLETFDEPRYVFRNGDVRAEFTVDELPSDTAWHFVERIDAPAPSVHSIQNFVVYDGEDDITEAILSDPNYTFLILSPSLSAAESSVIDKIDELYDYTQEYGYNLYCLTASSPEEIAEWQDNTGADYPFYSMDASTIQTIVRGNPGIVLLHDGVIVQKVRPVHLPEEAELNAPLDELPFGQLRPYTFRRPLLTVLVVFFVPMLLLLLTSKTVEAYVVQARVRRVARLRKIREAVMEKNRKNKEENQL